MIVPTNASVFQLYQILLDVGLKNPDLLWCYKTQNPITTISKRPKNSTEEPSANDLFMKQKSTRFTAYKDTDKILGNTYGSCVLQDVEALTPNILAKTVETVQGGGVVVLLTDDCSTMGTDSHSKFVTEGFPNAKNNFGKRFAKSLKGFYFLNQQLEIVSGGQGQKCLDTYEMETCVDQPVEPQITKTKDQAEALKQLEDSISKKLGKMVISLTASRGRGKSATLGLAVSKAVLNGYSNIFITSPSAENVKTLFQFIVVGLKFSGYEEGKDFQVVRAKDALKTVMKINVFKTHKQTIQYIRPDQDQFTGIAELVVIDEAAAIPLKVVKKLIGPYLVLMASTIHGYEGTGRSLSLKLIKQMKEQKAIRFKELSLQQPIRYSANDPVEAWLNQLLCLSCTEIPELPFKPKPDTLSLCAVDKEFLFSGAEAAETLLQDVMALYVSSHYKNSPNDLQLLSDAPAHELFVLKAKDASVSLPPLCVIQIAYEGRVSQSTVRNNLNKTMRADGDMIPWLIAQQYQDVDFPTLFGARVVRIASYSGNGYGAECLNLVEKYYKGMMTEISVLDSGSVSSADSSRKVNASHVALDYLGVSYGLTRDLGKFWKKSGYMPVYLKQIANEITGEHTCVMIRTLAINGDRYVRDFRQRFIRLLPHQFRHLEALEALSILEACEPSISSAETACSEDEEITKPSTITEYDWKRLGSYNNNLIDLPVVIDLVPVLAHSYFETDDGEGADSVAGGVSKNFKGSKVSRISKISKVSKISGIQKVILLGVGVQLKDLDEISKELGVDFGVLKGLFDKMMRTFCVEKS